MSTITSRVTTDATAIPALRHRDTVLVFPADQDDFVTKYEANNDHLVTSTVPEFNAIGDEMNLIADEMNVVAGEVNTNAATATTQAGIATTQAGIATAQAVISTTKAGEASASATNAQLDAWVSEAEAMTAEAYATTPLNTLVDEYTSDGDGTFTAVPTTKYSALHWAATIDDINKVHRTESILSLLSENPLAKTDFFVESYHAGLEGGDGIFVWNPTAVKNTHNGGTIIDPDVTYPTLWTDQVQLQAWFDGSDNVTFGCWVRKYDGALSAACFGAKVSDSNNSIAIQTAGNTIDDLILDYDYPTTGTITLSNSRLSISGQGGIINSTSAKIIDLVDVTSIHIKDITLRCTLSENTSTAIFSNTGNHVTNSLIDNVTIYGTQQGISIEGNDNAFADFSYEGLSISEPTTDARNIISNCKVYDSLTTTPAGTGGSPAIYARGAFWTLKNNKVVNWYGPGILGGSNSIIEGNTIINMAHENGIYASGAINTTIVGNYVRNVITDCISFNSSEDCTATGNILISDGNGLFRVQDDCKNILMSNNILKTSSTTTKALRGFMNPNVDGCENIKFENNNINLGGASRTESPIIFGEVTATFKPSTNVEIIGNTFDGVNVSGATGTFYETTLAKIFSANECTFKDNTINNFVKFSTGALLGGLNYTIGFYNIANKYICTDATIYSSRHRNNGVRFACGSLGAVLNANYYGLILTIEKTPAGTTGQYTITFKQPVRIRGIKINSSNTNKVDGIAYDIFNPASSDDTVSSIIVTMFNLDTSAAEVPVYPNFNSSNLLSIDLNAIV